MVTTVNSQSGAVKTGFWRLQTLGGELRVNGFYRMQDRKGNQFSEKQESMMYMGAIALRTKSYFWHPKFITLEMDGEYAPSKADEKFLVIPDQAENRDLRKAGVRLSILPQNKFSVISYYNYGRVYNNRENLSSIRSTGDNWGSTLYYKTKWLPFSIGYTQWKQREDEIQTGRSFENTQKNLEARVSNSIGKYDKQELIVSRNDFFRKDYSQVSVSNEIYNAGFTSLIHLGKKKKSTINSLLSGNWQSGQEDFTRYQAIENINWELKHHFQLGNHYMFFQDERPFQTVTQHKAGALLRHQLFQSLNSQLGYDYTTTTQSFYDESLHRGNGELSYTKKIKKIHELQLSYRYTLQSEKWNSEDAQIRVVNESVTLQDGPLLLLARPYIDAATVRVKDATATIIYQLNLDYLLIPQGNFLQIQRVPGGQIANSATVYVDYTAIQPGSYNYISTNYTAYAGVSLFKRLIGFYYRKSVQDFTNQVKTDFLTLNYYDQEVMGAKLEYKAFTGGAEYDKMNSTVLPYTLMRYFLNVQGTVKNKWVLSANGNLYDYSKLNDLKNVRFTDVSGSVLYRFTPKISLSASVNYRKQEGQGMELEMLNARSELVANLHKLRFAASYNYYDRTIYTERIQFNAVNIQIARRF